MKLLLIYICMALQLIPTVGLCSKPRLVISSDFPPIDVIPGTITVGAPEKRSDPDDVQSMVRFLVYSNEFEVLGLIAASGTLANVANKQHILDVLNIYEKAEGNLRKHDPGFPTADALRKVTKAGLSGTYAKLYEQILGEGKDSEASDYIIRLLKDPDTEPIWFCFWGGTQELAQALWRMKQARNPKLLKQAIAKIRVYMIAYQDGTGQWLMENFPDMFIIVNKQAFKGIFYNAPGADTTMGDLYWINKHIRIDHGPLGMIYPESGWDHTKKGVIEGDTPSFLYMFSGISGLSHLEKPGYGGWGGLFRPLTQNNKHWMEAEPDGKSINMWQYAFQNDFAARMDWCHADFSAANHNPVVVINGESSKEVLMHRARAGERVKLSAGGSYDPDTNKLSYRWFIYPKDDNVIADPSLIEATAENMSFIMPSLEANGELHIICEVKDNGIPALYSYRRIIFTH
ncbi:DUF1593 domain-containing protein [Rhodocytophaga aerolata]|uniref:DUF1593 domain-containing protein n=1 Tax=Rhodocytophaga aerolata TaxID=455078 RepID=A0ABT8RKA8_9BACT|nr:nucleoside hydrolase-like domain-containing protein [Rhodocytophaga aerolata]MDO1451778.1 DUF1593 domain-containing protein [Rhodocytophaga aerolata]